MIRSCLVGLAFVLFGATAHAADPATLSWVALPDGSGMEVATEPQDRGLAKRRFYLRDPHVFERWTMDCAHGRFQQLQAEGGDEPVTLDPKQPGHLAIFRLVCGRGQVQ